MVLRANILYLIFILTICCDKSDSTRPHIILLLADDLGWNDVSFHGSNQIPTPNLDSLAYNGIILNRHYVQPTCTPTRSALLTGRYPIHTTMQGGPMYPAEPNGLPLEFKLLPEYLRDLGYRTHMVGKWHLGYYNMDYTPLRRGFESYLGCYNGFVGYYDYINTDKYKGKVYSGFDLRRNETPAWDLVGKYATDVFNKEAIRVIEAHEPEEPLFLYMAYTAVHSTHEGRFLEAPQAKVNSFKYIMNPNRRTFAAMLSKMDESVGMIVDALQKREMLENSIILFFSDNGAPSLEDSEFRNWGSNFPLRGTKRTLWEGGVRSPTFVWTPQTQGSPRVSNLLLHVSDWLPTLYSAAGGNSSDLDSTMDGKDQWDPIIKDLPSNRDQVLVNINEKLKSEAIITNIKTEDGDSKLWKLVKDPTESLRRYHVSTMDEKSPMNPLYNLKRIRNSLAYKAISTLPTPVTDSENMIILRKQCALSCPRFLGYLQVPNCKVSPCLFDITEDPCERTNIASNNDEIVQILEDALTGLRETLVPQSNKPFSYPVADPKNFNNTWTAWISNEKESLSDE